jgi:hypothetical protein
VVDTAGTKLLSRRVETNEAEDLCGLIDEVLFLARGVVWPSARLEMTLRYCWLCCGNGSNGSFTFQVLRC